mmetsp:Transcript_70191/g.227212  ORF Transcript_70191/g.227212 Transcript_70191/m.227212 type:complete len:319 (-) Transcript_70191:317-1273(-)
MRPQPGVILSQAEEQEVQRYETHHGPLGLMALALHNGDARRLPELTHDAQDGLQARRLWLLATGQLQAVEHLGGWHQLVQCSRGQRRARRGPSGHGAGVRQDRGDPGAEVSGTRPKLKAPPAEAGHRGGERRHTAGRQDHIETRVALRISRHQRALQEEVNSPAHFLWVLCCSLASNSGSPSSGSHCRTLGRGCCHRLKPYGLREALGPEGVLRLDIPLQGLSVVPHVLLLVIVQVTGQELAQHLQVPGHATEAVAVRQGARGIPQARAVRAPLLEEVQEVIGEQRVADAVAPEVLVVDPRREKLEPWWLRREGLREV